MLGRHALLFGALSLSLLGCGASGESGPPPASPKAASTKTGELSMDDVGAARAPDKLDREALKTVLPMGLPWLLRRVWPEEVVRENKFVGWRIVAVPEEWTGLDVRPDDIVTRVNGKSVETPDQLWDAWTSLATATELRVTYERGSETKEITLPIAGPPAPELYAALTTPSPPPRRVPIKRGTIVIESRDPMGDARETN